MSTNVFTDIAQMHAKFVVSETVDKMDKNTLAEFLKFRIKCLDEELRETRDAAAEKDWDGVVDGIIDLIVFGLGTLDSFKIDANKAWDAVLAANIVKRPGMKETRKNEFGFPDLIKPEGWVAPSHKDNIGLLSKLD